MMICKCGNNNFELMMNAKLQCTNCGKYWNPFSAQEHKVMEKDGFHYFWVVMRSHFLDRWDLQLPDLEEEELLKDCIALKNVSKQNKAYFTPYHGGHLFWKFKFNNKKRRLELELITVTSTKVTELKYEKNPKKMDIKFK